VKRISFRISPVFLLFSLGTLSRAGSAIGFNPESVRKALCEVLIEGHLTCSGFFIDAEGTCLTCAHAFAGEENEDIELLLADGRRVKAALGGTDAVHDAAVLFADVRPSGGGACGFLGFAERRPGVGERVFIAGTPLYRHRLFLEGSLAADKPRYEYNPDLKTYVPVLYVHALAPRGTSGGPWLNERGEVVGIQSGCMAQGETQWGIAFMVPSEFVKALIAEPKKKFVSGDLGAGVDELWELPRSVIRIFGPETREGLSLCRLLKGGACDRAGLGNGDLLVGAEGKSLRFRADLLDLIRARKPGDTVELEVVRKKKRKSRREKTVIRLDDASEAARRSRR